MMYSFKVLSKVTPAAPALNTPLTTSVPPLTPSPVVTVTAVPLATAFALACNTPILLMDEPTNGLDIPSKTIFRRILAEQIHPDRIIIISTHQVRDLELLIDAVIILHDCRIALCEKAEHIQKIVNFGKITPETDPDRIIYQDVAVRGTVGMTSHLPDEPQQGIDDFDLEILFNAVTHPSEGERIQNILNGCSV